MVDVRYVLISVLDERRTAAPLELAGNGVTVSTLDTTAMLVAGGMATAEEGAETGTTGVAVTASLPMEKGREKLAETAGTATVVPLTNSAE